MKACVGKPKGSIYLSN